MWDLFLFFPAEVVAVLFFSPNVSIFWERSLKHPKLRNTSENKESASLVSVSTSLLPQPQDRVSENKKAVVQGMYFFSSFFVLTGESN